MASQLPTRMHAPTTTTETTTGPNAPSSVPPPRGSSRTARYWIALAAAGTVLAAGVAGVGFVDTPYATLAPGSARATGPLVHVDGAETFEPSGELLFLTVGVDGHVTLLEAAAGWIDPDVEVLPREAVFGRGVSPEQNRELNAIAMVGSKQTAVVVALTRLGVELDPTGTGAVVLGVEPGTPADGSLEVGDTIVAVDGDAIELYGDLAPAVSARRPGDRVTLTVEAEDGATREVPLTLAARPDDPEAGFLGVTGDTRGFDPGLPFDVDIDSGQVGGPSAGLAFTLAVLDVLTEGELTGGLSVAVTGTIGDDGGVGEVGGVVQKAAAAADAGAELFLVPPGELDDALANDHGMEVVAVATLDEALAALEAHGGDPLPAGLPTAA
jgi:PDZ domain-containing protein